MDEWSSKTKLQQSNQIQRVYFPRRESTEAPGGTRPLSRKDDNRKEKSQDSSKDNSNHNIVSRNLSSKSQQQQEDRQKESKIRSNSNSQSRGDHQKQNPSRNQAQAVIFANEKLKHIHGENEHPSELSSKSFHKKPTPKSSNKHQHLQSVLAAQIEFLSKENEGKKSILLERQTRLSSVESAIMEIKQAISEHTSEIDLLLELSETKSMQNSEKREQLGALHAQINANQIQLDSLKELLGSAAANLKSKRAQVQAAENDKSEEELAISKLKSELSTELKRMQESFKAEQQQIIHFHKCKAARLLACSLTQLTSLLKADAFLAIKCCTANKRSKSAAQQATSAVNLFEQRSNNNSKRQSDSLAVTLINPTYSTKQSLQQKARKSEIELTDVVKQSVRLQRLSSFFRVWRKQFEDNTFNAYRGFQGCAKLQSILRFVKRTAIRIGFSHWKSVTKRDKKIGNAFFSVLSNQRIRILRSAFASIQAQEFDELLETRIEERVHEISSDRLIRECFAEWRGISLRQKRKKAIRLALAWKRWKKLHFMHFQIRKKEYFQAARILASNANQKHQNELIRVMRVLQSEGVLNRSNHKREEIQALLNQMSDDLSRESLTLIKQKQRNSLLSIDFKLRFQLMQFAFRSWESQVRNSIASDIKVQRNLKAKSISILQTVFELLNSNRILAAKQNDIKNSDELKVSSIRKQVRIQSIEKDISNTINQRYNIAIKNFSDVFERINQTIKRRTFKQIQQKSNMRSLQQQVLRSIIILKAQKKHVSWAFSQLKQFSNIQSMNVLLSNRMKLVRESRELRIKSAVFNALQSIKQKSKQSIKSSLMISRTHSHNNLRKAFNQWIYVQFQGRFATANARSASITSEILALKEDTADLEMKAMISQNIIQQRNQQHALSVKKQALIRLSTSTANRMRNAVAIWRRFNQRSKQIALIFGKISSTTRRRLLRESFQLMQRILNQSNVERELATLQRLIAESSELTLFHENWVSRETQSIILATTSLTNAHNKIELCEKRQKHCLEWKANQFLKRRMASRIENIFTCWLSENRYFKEVTAPTFISKLSRIQFAYSFKKLKRCLQEKEQIEEKAKALEQLCVNSQRQQIRSMLKQWRKQINTKRQQSLEYDFESIVLEKQYTPIIEQFRIEQLARKKFQLGLKARAFNAINVFKTRQIHQKQLVRGFICQSSGRLVHSVFESLLNHSIQQKNIRMFKAKVELDNQSKILSHLYFISFRQKYLRNTLVRVENSQRYRSIQVAFNYLAKEAVFNQEKKLLQRDSGILKLLKTLEYKSNNLIEVSFLKLKANSQRMTLAVKRSHAILQKKLMNMKKGCFDDWRFKILAMQESQRELASGQTYIQSQRLQEQSQNISRLLVENGVSLNEQNRRMNESVEKNRELLLRFIKKWTLISHSSEENVSLTQAWNTWRLAVKRANALKRILRRNTDEGGSVFSYFQTWRDQSRISKQLIQDLSPEELVSEAILIEDNVRSRERQLLQADAFLTEQIQLKATLENKREIAKRMVVRLLEYHVRQGKASAWRQWTRTIADEKNQEFSQISEQSNLRIYDLQEEILLLEQILREQTIQNKELRGISYENIKVAETIQSLTASKEPVYAQYLRQFSSSCSGNKYNINNNHNNSISSNCARNDSEKRTSNIKPTPEFSILNTPQQQQQQQVKQGMSIQNDLKSKSLSSMKQKLYPSQLITATTTTSMDKNNNSHMHQSAVQASSSISNQNSLRTSGSTPYYSVSTPPQ